MGKRVVWVSPDEWLLLYATAIDLQARRMSKRRKTAKVREGVATGDMDCANAVGGPHIDETQKR